MNPPPHHDEALSVYAPALLSTGVSSGVSLGEGVFVEQLARPLLKESLKLTDVPAPWCVIQSLLLVLRFLICYVHHFGS